MIKMCYNKFKKTISGAVAIIRRWKGFNMKRIFLLIPALTIADGLIGCGNSDTKAIRLHFTFTKMKLLLR